MTNGREFQVMGINSEASGRTLVKLAEASGLGVAQGLDMGEILFHGSPIFSFFDDRFSGIEH